MASFTVETNPLLQKRCYYRITGKQSVERLVPLFEKLATKELNFIPVGTDPDYRYSKENCIAIIREYFGQQPLVIWETTCEKELKEFHDSGFVRNKLLNSQVLESKSNFAFLQQTIPSCQQLTTYVARNADEVLGWCNRHFTSTSTTSKSWSDTSDWWMVKASAGNGGRDIWLIHQNNYNNVFEVLPKKQEYVIQK
jgi:hypothetical protein